MLFSAYSVENGRWSPTVLRLPKGECPVIWVHVNSDLDAQKSSDKTTDPVVPLGRNLYGTFAEVLFGRRMEIRVPGWNAWKFFHQTSDVFSLKFTWMTWQWQPMRKKLMSNLDLEEPTRIADQVYLACPQCESETIKSGDGEVGHIQQSGIIQCKHSWEFDHWRQAQRNIMESRHARSCTQVCWTLLRIVKQNGR